MATRLIKPTPVDVDLWPILEAALRQDDGSVARAHLAAGRAIYYSEDDTPRDTVIKEHPDGRRELVRFDIQGEHRIRDLA
ncbi:hypothetical protein FHS31_001211 [Sphingomonas vulcanisoli]|uniref:Uncharacterized protein n=1 Tax=Sphingomonas vulcanisoli TaxID=1658060 RepID=A0ABX0TV14_9SPHN|nr:hypothetical protein [Sphingomonas vulcanisoli]NIJ07615.1 hypothetical protein [Sphingomonas vulcanisoli]